MKKLALVFSTLLATLPSFSQDSENNPDNYFASLFVGTWEHISSTFPSGSEIRYSRDFQFNEDGTGICTMYEHNDTSTTSFEWKVQDSLVFLFIIDENTGQKTNTDVQYISMMSDDGLFLDQKYAAPELRKVTYYRRKIVYDVAKY